MTSPVEIVTRQIPERTVPGKRLGRHVAHDSRSWDYRAEGAPVIADVLHASFGLPINQGNVGSCTANALTGAANSQPNFTGALALPHLAGCAYPHGENDAVNLYIKETTDEGQPYPQYDPGGTGLYVCRAARELGWIARWANAFTLDEALRALTLRPVITGVNWYDSFDSPDSSGVITISPGAQVRGGHEFVILGNQVAGQQVAAMNSWGPDWGVGGKFYFSWSTWEQLLAEQGDVTVPGAAVAR